VRGCAGAILFAERKDQMKSLATLAFLVTALSSRAMVLTQWDFNGQSSTTVPGGSSSPTPSVGLGTASLVGGVTASFASGIVNGGSSDPVLTSPPNFGWQTTTYAAQGAENGGRGVQFAVSTAGMTGVTYTFDVRHSNTSSRWIRFDYSVDGGMSWVQGTAGASTIFEGTSGDTWFNNRTVDLSTVAAVQNNANFRFRTVTIFGPAAGPFDDNTTYTSYSAANPTSTYATGGTLRWDMVTVNAVPEPGTIAALVAGFGLFAARRRRKA